MHRTRTLIATTILALCGALPGAAIAHSSHAGNRKHHHVCKARGHRKHPRRCHASSSHRRHKSVAKNSETRVFSMLQAASYSSAANSPSQSSLSSGSARESSAVRGAAAAPCQNTTLLPTASNLALIREAIFCLVNQERSSHGESPLTLNGSLENAAQAHSDDMVANNYFSHVSPDGLRPAERVLNAGYLPNPKDDYAIGENIAWATLELATPKAILEAWIASPEHLENILEARYTETGIGIEAQAPPGLAQGNAGATYTQDFGVVE
ncbi:MAG TPA: CAP domain-containing protein [Solirubrobacteraceae bacterium]